MDSGKNGENEGLREKPQKLADSKVYSRKSFKGLKDNATGAEPQTLTLGPEDANSSQSLVTIQLSSRTKQEMREIRKKLEGELVSVRRFIRKIEAEEGHITGGDGNNSGLQPLHQLSISTLENSQGPRDFVEKAKRAPKKNQLYQKSEFTPSESNKKKTSNKKKGGVEAGSVKFTGQVLKNCAALLDKLMKHKHGWVFNKPVDAKSLGLHDYFDIIKHPMDLGTVKSRLDRNWYKSPREFSEDVRLTFHNAMAYNPKGQDVHVMAELLLKMFEEKWTVIEADFMRQQRLAVDHDTGLPTPPSKKAPQRPMTSQQKGNFLDGSESRTHSVDPKPKPSTISHSRTLVQKKPKARDPNKREMTYDEKQKLSTSLQSLPSEKLDIVVQIIKKRTPSLSQHDDEIEVDIDTFDTETLWELDRFVSNYQKSLIKNKKDAEVSKQESHRVVDTGKNVLDQISAPAVVEAPKGTIPDGENTSSFSPVQKGKHVGHANKSGTPSGCSSGSRSSSSDSESDSSSGNGSDAVRSPKT